MGDKKDCCEKKEGESKGLSWNLTDVYWTKPIFAFETSPLIAVRLMPCNFFSGKARDAANITHKNPLGLIEVSKMLINSYW